MRFLSARGVGAGLFVDPIHERFAELELRDDPRLDLHRVACPRVAAGAGFAGGGVEGAEAGDLHLAGVNHRIRNKVDGGVEGAIRFLPGFHQRRVDQVDRGVEGLRLLRRDLLFGNQVDRGIQGSGRLAGPGEFIPDELDGRIEGASDLGLRKADSLGYAGDEVSFVHYSVTFF